LTGQEQPGRLRHWGVLSCSAAEQLRFTQNIVRKLRAGLTGAVLASLAGAILLIFPFGDAL